MNIRPFIPALLLALPATVLAQGTFPPPSGPTVPVMKTLTQVEPRTPIQSLAASPPYVISTSGSYYLTDNITVSGDTNVIYVNSFVSDVTIDLNGFTIQSTYASSGSGNAIKFGGSSARIRILNGSIKSGSVVASGTISSQGFVNGVYAQSLLKDSIISNLTITGCSSTGLYLDANSLVENCTVSHCSNGITNYYGITRNCVVADCLNYGITTKDAESCRASAYTATGLTTDNATNCTGVSNGSYGIFAGTNATNCSGSSTSGYGLYAINATNCSGSSSSSTGLNSTNASNCHGSSSSGIGLSATSALNCRGTSQTGIGLYATSNATNCTGRTSSNTAGVQALYTLGTANTCNGSAAGSPATAIKAAIAIGCTYGPGILDVPAGKTFNM